MVVWLCQRRLTVQGEKTCESSVADVEPRGLVLVGNLREGVQKRPVRAGVELRVARLAILAEDGEDVAGRNGAELGGLDHEAAGLVVVPERAVAQVLQLFLQPDESIRKVAEGVLRHLGEVDAGGVAALEDVLSAKAQVAAYEDGDAAADAGGEGLVMGVADANRICPVGVAGAREGEDAEHLPAVAGQAEAFGGDGVAARRYGVLHGLHDIGVGHGTPGVGWRGSGDEREFRAVHVSVAWVGEDG